MHSHVPFPSSRFRELWTKEMEFSGPNIMVCELFFLLGSCRGEEKRVVSVYRELMLVLFAFIFPSPDPVLSFCFLNLLITREVPLSTAIYSHVFHMLNSWYPMYQCKSIKQCWPKEDSSYVGLTLAWATSTCGLHYEKCSRKHYLISYTGILPCFMLYFLLQSAVFLYARLLLKVGHSTLANQVMNTDSHGLDLDLGW